MLMDRLKLMGCGIGAGGLCATGHGFGLLGLELKYLLFISI